MKLSKTQIAILKSLDSGDTLRYHPPGFDWPGCWNLFPRSGPHTVRDSSVRRLLAMHVVTWVRIPTATLDGIVGITPLGSNVLKGDSPVSIKENTS